MFGKIKILKYIQLTPFISNQTNSFFLRSVKLQALRINVIIIGIINYDQNLSRINGFMNSAHLMYIYINRWVRLKEDNVMC